MHDLRFIRENPETFDAGLAARGVEPVAARVLDLDERRRALTTRMQEAQSRRNEASKAIGHAMDKGDAATAEALKAEVAGLKTTLPALEEEERALGEELDALLAGLPNIPDDSVPHGADENGNQEVARWGQQR
ncbi:MAG: serine--tRNA ligase, partial [Croceibacterium sp.]